MLQAQYPLRILKVNWPPNAIRQTSLCLWSLHKRQCPARQLLQGHLANVDPVHPQQLIRVIDAARDTDTVKRKGQDQLLTCEKLCLIIVRPTEQGQEIEHRLGQVPLIPEIAP